MTSINETIAGYIAAWNETDAGRRRAIVERTWSDDGTYLRLASRQQRPCRDRCDDRGGPANVSRLPLPPVERHRGASRPGAIQLVRGGTEIAPLFFGGTDFAVIAEDGRFRAVTGFTDAMPSLT